MNFIHCNNSCGSIRSLSPSTPYFITRCFHILCGNCYRTEASKGNGAKCPVCQQPLKVTLLNGKCPKDVLSYFLNPVGHLRQSVKRFKNYRAFQKSQLRGYKKIIYLQRRIIRKLQKQRDETDVKKGKVEEENADLEVERVNLESCIEALEAMRFEENEGEEGLAFGEESPAFSKAQSNRMEDFALFQKGAAENHNELAGDQTSFRGENHGSRELMSGAHNNQPVPNGNVGHGGTHRVNINQLESAADRFQRNVSFQSDEAQRYLVETNRPSDGRHGIDGNSSFQHRSNFPSGKDQSTYVSHSGSFRPIQQDVAGRQEPERRSYAYAALRGQPELPQPISSSGANAALGSHHSMFRPMQERVVSIYTSNGAVSDTVSKDLGGRLVPQTSGINTMERPIRGTNFGINGQSHGTMETSKGPGQNVVLSSSFQHSGSAQLGMNGDEKRKSSNHPGQNSLQFSRNPQTAVASSMKQPTASLPRGIQQYKPIQMGMNGDENRKYPNHPDQNSKLQFGRNPQTTEAASTATRQQAAASLSSGFRQSKPVQTGMSENENRKYPNHPDQNSKLQFGRNPQTPGGANMAGRQQPAAGLPNGFQQYKPVQTGMNENENRKYPNHLDQNSRLPSGKNMNLANDNISYQFGKNLQSGGAAATVSIDRQQPADDPRSFQIAGSVQLGMQRDENRNNMDPADQNRNYTFGRNPQIAGATASLRPVGTSSGFQYHGQLQVGIMEEQSRNDINSSDSNTNNQFGRNPPIRVGVATANWQQPAGISSNFQHHGSAQMGIKNGQNLAGESNMCRFGRNPQTSEVLVGAKRQQSAAAVSQFPGRVNLQVSSTFASSGRGEPTHSGATTDIRTNPGVQCAREGNNLNGYGTAEMAFRSRYSTAAQSDFSLREKSMLGAAQPAVPNQSAAGGFAGSFRSYSSTRVGNEGAQGKNLIESSNISSEPTSYFAQLNPVKAAAAGVVTSQSFAKPSVAPTNASSRPTVNIGISFSSRNQQQSANISDTSHWVRRDVRPECSPAESNLASSYRAVAGWKSNW